MWVAAKGGMAAETERQLSPHGIGVRACLCLGGDESSWSGVLFHTVYCLLVIVRSGYSCPSAATVSECSLFPLVFLTQNSTN